MLSLLIVPSQLAQQRWDNVVTMSRLTLSQRCVTVENESCGDVGLQCCDNIAVQRCQDVATKLLQRRHNIKHLVSRPFYNRQFWFLSHHRIVRELQKYLSIESSLWQARPTLVNSWLCLFLVCKQDKVARLGAKVAMKGLDREKKHLQHNIVNLFPDIPTVPDRWSLHGEWTWNTHTHTKVLSGIKHRSFLFKRTLNLWLIQFEVIHLRHPPGEAKSQEFEKL